jgi:hypothetical protein
VIVDVRFAPMLLVDVLRALPRQGRPSAQRVRGLRSVLATEMNASAERGKGPFLQLALVLFEDVDGHRHL